MATNTYVALDKVTANGSVSSITFSSIASTYTDLVLVIQGANSNVSNARWKLNGDTGTNYSWTGLGGTGSSAVSTRIANTSTPQLDWYGYFDSNQSNLIAHFMNYSNTTTFKTVLTRSNNAANGVAATVGLWRNTAAITTIEIVSSNGNWNSGSTFSLYGIAAAGVSPAAKATGGTIYSDSQYYYHVFGSTGTFTPLSSLTADVLVVAGGGAGGGNYGGAGGGAGGLLAFTSQSLTATNYTCTVGAGGAGSTNPNATGGLGGDSQFGALTLVKGGGGGAAYASVNGATGGSGGGGTNNGSAGSATSGQGFAGGAGAQSSPSAYPVGGGGGGSGAVGTAGATPATAGNGGNGINTYSSWLTATGFGVSGYIAGGGGGGVDTRASSKVAGTAGFGGGGNGSSSTAGSNATANTGSGGGGASDTSTGGNGGSGVVIVRYAK